MGNDIDQRHVVTSQVRVDEESASTPPIAPDPDNEITDLSMQTLAPVVREEPPPDVSEEITDTGAAPVESPWRLNALGIALVAALVFALAGMVILRIKLNHTRAALAEAETAEEAAESAVARDPVEVAPAIERAPGPMHDAAAAPAPVGADAASSIREAEPATAKHEQLILLLTVGTEHYAQKQLRALQDKCSAPLAVYRQRRGRCAYSQCFAVALPAADAEQARACGQVSGQSIRDRDDFIGP